MQNGKSQSVHFSRDSCVAKLRAILQEEQLLVKWASPLMSLLFFAHSKEAEDEQKRGGGGEGVT